MNSSDTITISVNDYAENEYLDNTTTIDTSMLSGSTISTITLGGAGGAGSSGYVYSTNGTGGYGAIPLPIGSNGVFINSGSGYSFTNPQTETGIKLGEEFSIVAPKDGGAKLIYKDQEMEIGQLFGMFNAFKTLLKSVAEDPEFCAKHPEIRDMAYGYLVEELKR